MSLTADGEFFKCDMCGIYLHMNIFCSHRRQCKGLNSKEMKKELIAEVQQDLDKAGRDNLMALEGLAADFDGDIPTKEAKTATDTAAAERARAPLERQQELSDMKRNATWQRQMFDEEDAELEARLNNIPDDILDGFEGLC